MKPKQQSPIFSHYRELMDSSSQIIDETFEQLPKENKCKTYIQNHFSEMIGEIEKNAYEIFKKQQNICGTQAMLKHFGLNRNQPIDASTFAHSLNNSFEELNTFFLALSQSRKARAGKAFEDIIKRLFKALEYPFDEQIVINGKPDFLLPSEKHYKNHAMDCIIFTAKRTLRERWRQIVTEGTRGLGFFLATIDKDVSSNALREMKENRIYLVVETQLKNSIEGYKDAPNVISFERFFEAHLNPAMKRWQENKVV